MRGIQSTSVSPTTPSSISASPAHLLTSPHSLELRRKRKLLSYLPESDEAGGVGADAPAGDLHDEAGAVPHPLGKRLRGCAGRLRFAARLVEQLPEGLARGVIADACIWKEWCDGV